MEEEKENCDVPFRLYEHDEATSDGEKESIRAECAPYIDRAKICLTKIRKEQQNSKKAVKVSVDGLLAEDSSSDSGEDRDKKELPNQLGEAIVSTKFNVKWSDVVGLERAKQALYEAIILPIKCPYLFTDGPEPWKGILLFGPPGTGKSFLAKALATEADHCTFFSMSYSGVCGSEKQVKNVFEMARQQKPSIIFIEEIDSLMSSCSNESESARRKRNQFLVQMKGFNNDGILVLGATSTPWIVDAAVRRMFEQRFYIPLPDEMARLAIIKLKFGNIPYFLTGDDLRSLAKQTAGFSGADIALLVKEALMQPIRFVIKATHFCKVRGPSPTDPKVLDDDLLTPCSPNRRNAIEMSFVDVPSDKLLKPIVTMRDMLHALSNTKPSVNDTDVAKLKKFMEDFGGQEG